VLSAHSLKVDMTVKDKLSVHEDLLSERLGVALAGASHWEALTAQERHVLPMALKLATLLQELQATTDELHLQRGVLYYGAHIEAALRQNSSREESLGEAFFNSWLKHATTSISNIESALNDMRYPFMRAGGETTVFRHIRDHLPKKLDSVSEHIGYIGPLLAELQSLYSQVMRFLAEIAARYETHLGVLPVSIRLAGRSDP
jgi:hypothetical protein